MDEQTPTVQPAPAPHHPAPTGDGMVALSYFLSGILFYGGLGWAGAHYLGQAWMLPVGLVLGFVTSMYLVIKRYSSEPETAGSGRRNQTSEKEQ
ncbi:AtpZ/AtpI family protein [Propionibacteriaceae bacterium Y1923]|uniref:AtpZ/AtpI family protein n=1 Tax=Aestuariimicrobium sp. Y1814 TaxID=3418742 RepID=UPI003C21457B